MTNGNQIRYFTLPRRYRGPSLSGNGGYAAGSLVRLLDQAGGTVSLKFPPPLDTPLPVEEVVNERGALLIVRRPDSGDTMMEATRDLPKLEVPPPPSLDDARRASAAFVCRTNHPFPECFVCGIARQDGLSIHPGMTSPGGIVAASWIPDPSLPAIDGVVDPAVVWAALDCPGAFAAMGTTVRELMLAQMAASLNAPVQLGCEYIVMGWSVSTEGRKERVGTALVSSSGEVVATAAALWIAPRRPDELKGSPS